MHFARVQAPPFAFALPPDSLDCNLDSGSELASSEALPLIEDFETMDKNEEYELNDSKGYHASQIVVEEERSMVANAYPGQRTEGTRNTQTRVRVCTPAAFQELD